MAYPANSKKKLINNSKRSVLFWAVTKSETRGRGDVGRGDVGTRGRGDARQGGTMDAENHQLLV